jgi:uncharacterized membrane protein
MNWKAILEYYYRHREAINGSIIGLIIALAFLAFGFIKVIFIAICVILGYYIGKKTGEDKYFVSKALRKIKNKIFPPRM